jgi:hypothetical protein
MTSCVDGPLSKQTNKQTNKKHSANTSNSDQMYEIAASMKQLLAILSTPEVTPVSKLSSTEDQDLPTKNVTFAQTLLHGDYILHLEAKTASANRSVVVSEVLWFLNSQFSKLPKNEISSIMGAFYTSDEVNAAKSLLVDFAKSMHADYIPVFTERKGVNKVRATIDDLLSLFTLLDVQTNTKFLLTGKHYSETCFKFSMHVCTYSKIELSN